MIVMSQLPLYQCHKRVRAAKIKAVEYDFPNWIVSFEGSELSSISVASGFVAKHKPESGGYFVEYEDGYQSFSPAEAFESGYSLIDE